MPDLSDAALDDLATFIDRTENHHELEAALSVGGRLLEVGSTATSKRWCGGRRALLRPPW